MDATVALSLVWASALALLFGVGLYRRWQRHTLPLVGTALFVTSLFSALAIATIALELGDPTLRRTFAFCSWGAFTAAAVFYATVLADP